MAPAKLFTFMTMAAYPTFLANASRRCLHWLPLLAITVALGCVLALFNTGPADALPEGNSQRSQNASLSSTPIFNEANDEAVRHVDDYLKSIDTAMSNGLEVLRGGDGKSITAQGRYFNALVNAGYAQFGSSYYDPLGSCGVAGSSARHLWHTQVRAISGETNIAGEVGKARTTLQRDRQACLDSVRLPLEEAVAWAPTQVTSPSLVPTWATSGAWPETTAERTSTNL
ncbi:hypothetical protein FAS41_16250 [Pseudomonas nicosulfuronedens]|uniref:Uncharacterized protein n=2 Tax=Pseudomonas nicosulfuronedens TaxID=2571105 RepID=A0A5R9QYY3_9PSED|nr:hypothetical protein [Pseudomonas nicosulfuronedens]TLX75445.1 hypothetical protein FAS41_16250 [Pseudomonas nicosulfuronedens]